MEKPENDILKEKYKGAGPVVTGMGYAALTHLAATVTGFLAIGAIGTLASGRTMAIKEAFNEFSTANKTSPHFFKRIPAHVAGWIPYVADKISGKVVKGAKTVFRSKTHSSPITGERLNAFMFAGGIGGATGWVGSTIWGFAKGGHQGNAAKRQFERAKTEISSLREDNADLEKINDDLHAKYVKAATRLNSLYDSQENSAQLATENSELPAIKELPDAAPAQAPTTPTEVQLSQYEHQGKLADKELAVA